MPVRDTYIFSSLPRWVEKGGQQRKACLCVDVDSVGVQDLNIYQRCPLCLGCTIRGNVFIVYCVQPIHTELDPCACLFWRALYPRLVCSLFFISSLLCFALLTLLSVFVCFFLFFPSLSFSGSTDTYPEQLTLRPSLLCIPTHHTAQQGDQHKKQSTAHRP